MSKLRGHDGLLLGDREILAPLDERVVRLLHLLLRPLRLVLGHLRPLDGVHPLLPRVPHRYLRRLPRLGRHLRNLPLDVRVHLRHRHHERVPVLPRVETQRRVPNRRRHRGFEGRVVEHHREGLRVSRRDGSEVLQGRVLAVRLHDEVLEHPRGGAASAKLAEVALQRLDRGFHQLLERGGIELRGGVRAVVVVLGILVRPGRGRGLFLPGFLLLPARLLGRDRGTRP
mmetsp:Transcript_1690/g.7016  ORF Transcript_1690/g.7016 Transcript_1690/m.7016 type:complete len:228 (+) Transcript_1690:43-726(+)